MTEALKLTFMKRFILTCAMAVMALVVCVHAQTISADFTKMDQLVMKINKALEKQPKNTDVEEIDTYVQGASDAGTGSVLTAQKLHNFYSREIGETVDGVTTVNETKPSLNDWLELAADVTIQTKGLTDLGKSAVNATNALKGVNPMKAVGMGKNIKWSGEILKVTGEALAEQAKAIGEIIKTLKSKDNL